MDSQKSVTLTKCKIYNWNTQSVKQIQLQLCDNSGNILYDKFYVPWITDNEIFIKVAIKLTFSLQEKQIIVRLNNITEDRSEQRCIQFVVDFQKLTGRQNFFKTDFDNCIVNLATEKSSSLQLPSIKVKNKNEEIESFIKEREDFLRRLTAQFSYTKYPTNISPQDKLNKHQQKDTPYFEKEFQENNSKNSQSSKIKQLIAKARNLRKEQLLMNKNSEGSHKFYTSTYPSLQEMVMCQQEEEQISSDHSGNDGNANQIKHYHEHRHIVCNNETAKCQYNYEYLKQCRTNDSYSVYSSRSEQFLDNLQKNASQSRFFDAKSPFKQRFL